MLKRKEPMDFWGISTLCIFALIAVMVIVQIGIGQGRALEKKRWLHAQTALLKEKSELIDIIEDMKKGKPTNGIMRVYTDCIKL